MEAGKPGSRKSIYGELGQLGVELPHQQGAAGHNPCLPLWEKEGPGGQNFQVFMKI